MNVIGTRPDGWWTNRPAAAANLVSRVERWARAGGHQVTVVFEQPPSPPLSSSVLEVAHAPSAARNSADDEIVRLVQADGQPQQLTVVTSDTALARRVHAVGASVFPAARFRDLIDGRPERGR